MKTLNIDYSLYLVTDRGLARGRSTLDIVRAAVKGGVTCVQLREKECSTREFIDQALSIKDILKTHNIPLIINDRLDVAQAVEADGVHLGQTDMPLATAKNILGDSMVIGISAESLPDAVAAEKGLCLEGHRGRQLAGGFDLDRPHAPVQSGLDRHFDRDRPLGINSSVRVQDILDRSVELVLEFFGDSSTAKVL